MNIKTAVHLAIGVGIGFFIFGKDDDKEKVIRFIKNKLKWLLYADNDKCEFKPNATVKYNGAMGPITYTQMPKREKNFESDDKYWETLLQFETKDEADQCLERIIKRLDNYGYLTVHELAIVRNRVCDYTWDAYGWMIKVDSNISATKLQVLYMQTSPYYKRYIIPLGEPRYLMQNDEPDSQEIAGDNDAE